MTPKIARFLAQHQPATPCLVLDVDRVEENFRALRNALPLARIYYAVKANPAPQVLERLVGLSSYFDAASIEEVDGVPRRRRPPGSDQLRQHHQEGVGDPPRACSRRDHVRVRFAGGTGEAGRACPRRAGLLPHPGGERGRRLAAVAQVRHHDRERPGVDDAKPASCGLDPYGLSFHVGSQQTTTRAYEVAIGKVAMLFTDLTEAGVNLRMMNLGGGFPDPLP